MKPPMKILIAAVVAASAPVAAAAQVWPVIVASGASVSGPHVRSLAQDVRDDNAGYRKPVRATGRHVDTKPSVLKWTTSAKRDIAQVPETDIQPKDEWFDDQGFRVTPTRLAFKQRF